MADADVEGTSKALQVGTRPFSTFFTDSHPNFQWHEPEYEMKAVAEENSSQRVILAGSCFSRQRSDTAQGFGNMLAGAMRRELVDFSRNNAGLWGALKTMEAARFVFRVGDLLIWEFPLTEAGKGGQPPTLNFEAPSNRQIASEKVREPTNIPY